MTTSPPEGAVAINDPSHWGTAAWLQVAAIIAVVVILHGRWAITWPVCTPPLATGA